MTAIFVSMYECVQMCTNLTFLNAPKESYFCLNNYILLKFDITMNTGAPIKPPRGIKPTKETSGLLISVIRALSASETNEQREIEKAKLEKEYKRSDQRLDELVSLHEQDLTEVMQIFSTLSERVTASREKIHAVKENLNACKQLLNCKREELLNLWLEGMEHKHVLQLLEEASTSPEKYNLE